MVDKTIPVRILYSYVKAQTELAYLVVMPEDEDEEGHWLPKSQVTNHSLMDNHMDIPLWLAEKMKIKSKRPPKKPRPQGLNKRPGYARGRR